MSDNEKKQSAFEHGAVRRVPRHRRPRWLRDALADDALPGRLLILLSQLHRRDGAAQTSEARSTKAAGP